MNLAPMSDWRHGSSAPPRTLSPEAMMARGQELRASHVRVTLAREIHRTARSLEGFYAARVRCVSEPASPFSTWPHAPDAEPHVRVDVQPAPEAVDAERGQRWLNEKLRPWRTPVDGRARA